MLRHLFALVFALGLAMPLPAADEVAKDLKELLRLSFADAESAAEADPARACKVMEHHWQVFGFTVQEYGTRSGDWSFRTRLEKDLRRYCGHGLDAPLPSDGD